MDLAGGPAREKKVIPGPAPARRAATNKQRIKKRMDVALTPYQRGKRNRQARERSKERFSPHFFPFALSYPHRLQR
jgi:hypothetical protein